jgi:hypothetical protein|tara:strand:+ start:396 stop:509 length:114 start_codon:yes stop_codon:yes gene_type:complete
MKEELITAIFITITIIGIILQIRKDRKDYYEYFKTKN